MVLRSVAFVDLINLNKRKALTRLWVTDYFSRLLSFFFFSTFVFLLFSFQKISFLKAKPPFVSFCKKLVFFQSSVE